MEKKSTYRTLFDLTHEAVFLLQLPTVADVCKYIRWHTGIRNLDQKEIGKIVDRVCTPYEQKRER